MLVGSNEPVFADFVGFVAAAGAGAVAVVAVAVAVADESQDYLCKSSRRNASFLGPYRSYRLLNR